MPEFRSATVEDMREIVERQMEQSMEPSVKDRLFKVLNHHPDKYIITIEVSLFIGYNPDDEDDEDSMFGIDSAPEVELLVRALSPIWAPVDESFKMDQVPLLEGAASKEGLFEEIVQKYLDANLRTMDRLLGAVDKAKAQRDAIIKMFNEETF